MKAYKALCDGLGVPCRVIDTTEKWSKHEWNAVKISEKWYFVDNQAYYEIFERPEMYRDCGPPFGIQASLKYNPKKCPKISSEDCPYTADDVLKLYEYLEKHHLKKN